MAELVITELFPKSLTGKDSEVRQFKDAVTDEVKSHGGKLEHFALESGIVSMAIDDETVAYGLKEGLEQIPGVKVEVYLTSMELFVQSFNNRRKRHLS
jgi:hypothetical protein